MSDSLQPMYVYVYGFPGASVVKNPSAKQEIWVQSLGWEGPLEEEMATHSRVLAWEVHAVERIRHNLVTK